jgi:antitoxin ChpS
MWGGSCAIRLPKMAVESLGFREGEAVQLDIENGALVIRPAARRYALDDLVAQARELTPPVALDDDPQGTESL